jgi:FAD/FMN-containing dehydrogenase
VSTYGERTAALAAAFTADRALPVGLGKDTSNLFRDRAGQAKRHLDVRPFHHVLHVDRDAGWVDVEGMTPYEALVAATLPHGLMPAVVPELKTITIGGASAGVGIEASSFRYGLVHETLLELDVLTGTGEVLTCSPTNAHRDLFFGFPNSYGTLGYALRLRSRAVPIKPFVRIERERFDAAEPFFARLAQVCRSDFDFVDGVVFGANEIYLNLGKFVEHAPVISDYTYRHIYYRSIRDKPVDHLTAHDFIWRWDTDWFWCSKNVYAQVPLIRRLYGRKRLNSRTYTRIMRWNSRVGATRWLERLARQRSESIIQDVDVPIEAAAEYLAFYLREIDLKPVWICPIRPSAQAREFVLYPLDPAKLYVNFGFWDVKRTREVLEPGHFNRLVERKVMDLGGIKSLYSDSFFTRAEFDAAYGGDAYRALKNRYDPERRFGELYEKCVLRH